MPPCTRFLLPTSCRLLHRYRPGPIRRALIAAVLGALASACATDPLRRPAPDGPPEEAGIFRAPELVEVVHVDPTIRLDIRYATETNFMGRPMYPEARAFLQRPAAEALSRAQKTVSEDGYTLVLFDAYRPWAITREFWESTPPEERIFVADPRKGSKHNRGCAVDLSLADVGTGRLLDMPSEYDEFTERAFPDYAGGSDVARANRDYLRRAMEKEGFTVYEHEWWHFDYKDWQAYQVLNIPFSSFRPDAEAR